MQSQRSAEVDSASATIQPLSQQSKQVILQELAAELNYDLYPSTILPNFVWVSRLSS